MIIRLRFYLAFVFITSTLCCAAQNTSEGKIVFEKVEHDFGKIKEENGKVSYEFTFINTLNQPITITNVKASCGCTTPSWTKSPIESGKSGYVKAEFDPTNRPNAFTKSLSVSYSIGEGAVRVEALLIKGFVIPKAKTVLDYYPVKHGNLRFTSDYLNLSKLSSPIPVVKSIKFYNEGIKSIALTLPSTLPSHLKLYITPVTLNPKDSGTLTVTYDPKLKNDYGNVYDIVELKTNDSLNSVKKIYVVADISPYFPAMTKQDSLKAPRISFDRSIHDFGKITQGDIVKTNFVITNTGKSVLHLYKTKASCGCTVPEPEKSILKPGEKTNLNVTFNSANKIGQDSKSVTIYSNDPTYSEGMVVIKSDIQLPQQKDTTTISPSTK
jgi:hypothetical protein